MLLEEVLLRHKRLRLFVMHAGWPQLDSMIALMYAHPNVYVDTAALSFESMVPRPTYYRHLRGLVEAGFAKRIMFGSDFPNQVNPGIAAILAADFLTAEQKTDILCNNAARFLRLNPSPCMAADSTSAAAMTKINTSCAGRHLFAQKRENSPSDSSILFTVL